MKSMTSIEKYFTALGLILVLVFGGISSADEYKDITDTSHPVLPSALFYQPDYKVQWWYLTGHLSDDKGREFGYEATFFVAGVQRRQFASRFGVNNIYISHLALTDVAARQYLSREDSDSGAYGFAGASTDRLKVWVGNNGIKGDTREMRLAGSGGGFGLNLTLLPEKQPVLHGDKGVSNKASDDPLLSSYYFSFTRLRTQGTITIGGTNYTVNGTSWFDREISTQGLSDKLKGWDWFSLQLEDGREIMLYLTRRPDGTVDPASSGTLVRKDGSYTHLKHADFRVDVMDHYTSRRTKARYPSKWRISIPSESLALSVVPLLNDQEFVALKSTGNYYWEGACSVEGSARGRAYVELTGY